MTSGQKIKELRIANNLTQKELAEKLIVSYQTVSKWENDTNEPDLNTLRKLADIFSVSIDELVNPDKAKDNDIDSKSETKPDHVMVKENNITDHSSPLVDNSYDSYGKDTTFKTCQTYKKKKKILLWSILLGVLICVVTMILGLYFNHYSAVDIICWIIFPLVFGYMGTSALYCIINDTFIQDFFIDVAEIGIVKMPGIIFSFDADGLKFLICMKIILFLAGITLALGGIVLAFILSSFLAIFAFPYYVRRD